MHDHVDAWPFKEPVDARDVPDYYDIIKDPMGKDFSFQSMQQNGFDIMATSLVQPYLELFRVLSLETVKFHLTSEF